jgi:hypothetical protein
MRAIRFRLQTLACALIEDQAINTSDRDVLERELTRIADQLIEPANPLLEAISDAAIPWVVSDVVDLALDPRARADFMTDAGQLADRVRGRIAKGRAIRAEGR